ncbi:phosphoribosylanthranilate isomerase [Algoriphagus faecimaris]|uniref:Phosphoribosylanthranilate isomerase n=1 Tax=Algoriphagus faecimaris TaxID=686796 RepID=A0A1G6VBY2_9BACT|nr:phosphoribosylanthranilate isomerase [Algoriphagus faecimaris]SDD50903.1 phosphoribosylanthranilate isomerase [Algoriphagus faecimaris]
MALKTFVKVSGITNLSDARYCAGMQVDVLGFNLDKTSAKYVDPTVYSEITGWVSGPEFLGEFSSLNTEEIIETIKSYEGLEWVEHADVATLIELVEKGYKGILKIRLDELSHIEASLVHEIKNHEVVVHLFSEKESLSEKEVTAIQNIASQVPTLLGGSLTTEQFISLPERLKLKGISLEGGEEIKPGLKDFDELAEILESLEIED